MSDETKAVPLTEVQVSALRMMLASGYPESREQEKSLLMSLLSLIDKQAAQIAELRAELTRQSCERTSRP
jgi:hypothetical protein